MKQITRIGGVYKRGEPIYWKRKQQQILPPVPHSYSYITPATAAAPAAGEIVHGDNVINKLNVAHLDLDGNDIGPVIGQITTGDFVSVGATVYNVVAPTLADASGTFSYITIEPEVQKQPGVYPVRAWRDEA
jgi:hypothetical protein